KSDGNLRDCVVSFRMLLLVLAITKYLPEAVRWQRYGVVSHIVSFLLLVFTFGVIVANLGGYDVSGTKWHVFYGNSLVITAIFLVIVSESAGLLNLVSKANISPAIIFSASFLLIILTGTGLLLLPNSRTESLRVIDSLFTAVSAVCVTGLVVTNTATTFTEMGKIIIMCLIQIGGLGIMTFTGFFSYIFTSRSSFQQRLLLKDIFSSQSIGNLFKILTKIILFTFFTELAGALIILGSLDGSVPHPFLFSAFHSVSAFCNAGFTTLPDNLASPMIRNNYLLLTSIAILVILGGIGFPVLLKIYSYTKLQFIAIIRKIRRRRAPVRDEFGISGRIVVVTTLALLIGGTVLYYFLEKDKNPGTDGNMKVLFTAFFNSVTARTAGFNINDITRFGYPAIFLTIMLMWIGASPGSTGGGIKTSTFAIAAKTAWSNIRGRQTVEISKREISHNTVYRVLSIVILSLVVIGTGFFCLLLSEPTRNPVHLLYESVSAFCTVGLSIAGTSTFSDMGKIVLMILMFTGRIGPLVLLSGFLASKKKKYYTYPGTEILIN
ncbi:MAG: potassium transporter TrkG, partial [Bacteroidales bacterium]